MPSSIVQSAAVQKFHGVGVHDLGYVIQRVQALVGAAMKGDWVSFSMNLIGLFGKLAWSVKGRYKVVGDAQKKAKEDKDLPMTFIVDVTMLVISLVDTFNGFLSPTDGSRFNTGAASFESAEKSLELADPKKYWRGEAADAYAAMNAQLESLASRMQTLDGQMASLVTDQGKVVKHMHDIVSELLMACVAAQGTAVVLYVTATPAISYKFQMAFSAATLSALVGEEIKTAQDANDKADQTNTISSSYTRVATIANAIISTLNSGTSGASATSDGSTATTAAKRSGSTVSGSDAVSSDGSGESALHTTANSAASSAGLGRETESSSGGQRPDVSALAGADQRLGAAGEDFAELPPNMRDGQVFGLGVAQASQAVNDTPSRGLTTAHLARFAEIAGQIPKSSGGAAVHSQISGRAQPFAPAAPQDRVAAVPTTVGAGAASAAGHAERAPVAAAAVGPQQAQEPSPAELGGSSG